jgi:hypothetical protein
VIHDWEDDESLAILRTCRAAMSADASLILLERDLGPPNAVPAPKLSDLNMLVAPGGRERTVDEYTRLFDEAGLKMVATTPTESGHLVLEARPV